MRLSFWRKDKTNQLKAVEKRASIPHQQNIKSIKKAREKSDTLKAVLEQNNIVVELASAIGHRQWKPKH